MFKAIVILCMLGEPNCLDLIDEKGSIYNGHKGVYSTFEKCKTRLDEMIFGAKKYLMIYPKHKAFIHSECKKLSKTLNKTGIKKI